MSVTGSIAIYAHELKDSALGMELFVTHCVPVNTYEFCVHSIHTGRTEIIGSYSSSVLQAGLSNEQEKKMRRNYMMFVHKELGKRLEQDYAELREPILVEDPLCHPEYAKHVDGICMDPDRYRFEHDLYNYTKENMREHFWMKRLLELQEHGDTTVYYGDDTIKFWREDDFIVAVIERPIKSKNFPGGFVRDRTSEPKTHVYDDESWLRLMTFRLVHKADEQMHNAGIQNV